MKPILFYLPLPIVTPRLILTAPRIGDGIALNSAILESFPILTQFMPWAANRPSIDESEEFVRTAAANWILKEAAEPWLPLFMWDKKTDDFIGATGLHNINWQIPSGECGYWIKQKYSGHGFMLEAINALTWYAFKELRFNRFAITCAIDNLKSKHIPEKLDFALEGTLKNHRLKPQTKLLSDTLIYARYNLINLPELTVTW